MKENIYKGMLSYSDGRKELIAIPGVEKGGIVHIPCSIDYGNNFFLLGKDEEHTDEWFHYYQAERTKEHAPPKIVTPYKPYLH